MSNELIIDTGSNVVKENKVEQLQELEEREKKM